MNLTMATRNHFQKVLLINPPGKIYVRPDGNIGERKHCTPPLGLAYLAATLVQFDYDVEVIDVLAEGYTNERYVPPFIVYGLDLQEVVARAVKSAPDVIGISVLFSNRIGEARQIAAAIKRAMPEVTIVFGGQHCTAAPRDVMTEPSVDFVLAGEADLSIVHLMEALNGRMELDDVKGLFYRRDGQVIDSMEGVPAAVQGNGWKYYDRHNAPIPLELDSLPYPAWERFPLDAYWASAVRVGGGDIMRDRFAVMMSTRGCPHVCSFCTSPLLSGYKAYRRRDVGAVVEEIRYLIDSFGVSEIQFLDDNFFVSAKRVKDLCVRLAEEFADDDIIFSVPAGTEVNALDKEMIDLMTAANFHKVVLAIEAGDDAVQATHVDKHVKLDRIPDLVTYIRERGMTVHSLFMIGFPDERKAQIEKTVNMALSLDVDDFYISVATPLPGTPLYDECVERGLLVEDFDVENLRYSVANIKLPDTEKADIETLRRDAWLQMKARQKRQTGTVMKGSVREFSKYGEYEHAGLKTDIARLRRESD